MAHRNCFKNPNDNLNSGQYIDRKKSKAIYKASVDLANHGGVYHKKGSLGQNKGTYVGDVNISRDGKKCLIGANSYETLMAVTNGKYLEQPVSFDIRDSQDLWSGSIYKMDMDSNVSIMSHPDGSANTFSYPPDILANQTYPELIPPSDQGLVVDPCYTIFYPNTPGFSLLNSSSNCYMKNERAYQQYRRPIIQSHTYIKNYIKSKNGYVGDYYYPKPFSFDCCSNYVENIYNPVIVPPLTLLEEIIMITNSQAVADIFIDNIANVTNDAVITSEVTTPDDELSYSNIEYIATIKIEYAVFDELSDEHKDDIVNNLISLYATELGIDPRRIIIILKSGSLITTIQFLYSIPKQEKLTNDTIHDVVNQWIEDPAQEQFTNPAHTPYYGHIAEWDTSQVTDMSRLFEEKAHFDDPLTNWDTSKVTTMNRMFRYSSFNHPVSNFDTSSVTDMSEMFFGCSKFDQSVSNFDTSKVTTMYAMFEECSVFNHPVSNFDTSKVTNLSAMFQECPLFDQSVSNFDTTSVTTMEAMFYGASVFNQPLYFNTSKVTSMKNMFANCSSFNQNIRIWSVKEDTSLTKMFSGATAMIERYKNVPGFGSENNNYTPTYSFFYRT